MLRSIFSLKDLLYLSVCISCLKYGNLICLKCEASWLVKPNKTKVAGIDHYFVQEYNEYSARIILASKETGNKLARILLATAIARSIIFSVSEKKFNGQIVLVSIPSQKNVIRSRGRDHIGELITEVVAELSKMGTSCEYISILSLAKKSKDQSTLTRKERMVNMRNAFTVNNSQNPQDGIFLIDDLITTGASIKEGVRAAREAKITVNGIITACAVGLNSLIR